MRFGRLLLSTGLVGLATTVGGASLAEPEATKPKPTPATAGPAKPAEVTKAAQPEGAPTPGRPQGRPGHGPPGAPGHGPPGLRDKGPLGEGPAGAHPMGPGMPGHGMTPGGMPGHRFSELVAKEKAGTLTDPEKAQLEQLRKIHAMNMVRREVRIKDLRQKEKAGTLTDAEKGELAKITEIQTRFEGLKQKYLERAKDRQKRRHESKRLALQTFPNAGKEPRIRAEFIKHGKRLALLERARELAVASERDELVARIDQLLDKEGLRHKAWVLREKKAQKEAEKPQTEKGATP